MRIRDANKIIELAIATNLPAMLVSQPGVGKTSIIKQAAERGIQGVPIDLQIMHPSVSDPTDFKGFPFATEEDEAKFLPFRELNNLIRAERPTIAFLDDLGQASPSVQAACMQLILERQVGSHYISKNVLFMAATNRASDKAGVAGILEPVKSRFGFIVEIEPNVEDWVNWALANKLPFEVISFIKFRPNLLSAWKPEREIRNQPSPRTIAFLAKAFVTGVPDDIQFDAYKAIVGEACATEFIAFLRLIKNLPDIEQIWKTPDKVAVPKDPSQLYAISTAIMQHVSPQHFDAANQYISRLPAEFQVLYIKEIIANHKDWAKDSSFIKLAAKNAFLLT